MYYIAITVFEYRYNCIEYVGIIWIVGEMRFTGRSKYGLPKNI